MVSVKIVCVLNKELETGVALNAASHMALGLSAQAATKFPDMFQKMIFQDYKDSEGTSYPYISGLSLIVLRAKAGEIKKFEQQCREQKMLFTSFVSDMTGETYIEQLERLGQRKREDVLFYGTCVIAEKELLDPLTKRFSLWK